MFSITLTQPPSTNALYSNVMIKGISRRIKSQEYRTWQNEALAEYFQQRGANRYIRPPPPPYQITISIGKCSQARDCDNFAKPTLDFLVGNGVIQKDNLTQVYEVTLRKSFGIVPDGKITIEIDYFE